MATEFYTDQILDDNFHRIIDFNADVIDSLEALKRLAAATDTRLHVLEKVSARPVVVKSSKVLILTAMAVSAYAGYRYALGKVDCEMEYTKSRIDHPAGRKTNNDTTAPEN